MSKGGKVLLQPSFLSTHFIPDYEKIKRNNKICESHGVKSIATPFVGSVQQRKRVTAENGKRTRVELEDDGYRLSRDEDDLGHDSESVDSFEQALEMPRGCQRAPQSHSKPESCATMISERITRSTPQPNMDTKDLPPPIVQPQSEALANNNVDALVGLCEANWHKGSLIKMEGLKFPFHHSSVQR
ncbi:uncharacterized protein LOC131308213 isoform X1 [Rhododendron vialii]|uniref:uncharacterized protein LOC131308213 isoform X1 n=1 Tax=Rhododendron vialii TaxID=182163 RepID=UPI00265F3E8F|nr:uncharacterized protein LOC131308213 isoform X1 [Rhododendron vialii]